ncbi:MAG: hypothetical protein IKV54_02110 [Clostridia bacterium]|nr:hypothetical protein [Clostridia bacterium]
MGFGLLAIGYMFMLDFGGPNAAFDYLPDIIGFLLMFAGVSKLSVYNRGFRYAKILLIPLIAMGGVTLVFDIVSILGFSLNTVAQTASDMNDSLSVFFKFAYHVALMLGIRDIGRETELPRISFRAIRNMSVTVFYYLLYLVCDFLPVAEEQRQIFALIIQLFGIFVVLLNLVLLLSCYMRICLEGDEDMPIKPSRFAFVNRMNERLDNAINKLERSGEEVREYNESKKKKKKKGKKK